VLPRVTSARRSRIGARLRRAGGVALDSNGHREINPAALVRAVQAEVFPFEANGARAIKRSSWYRRHTDNANCQFWWSMRAFGRRSIAFLPY
jgi:hypothetical protein